ncbi:hypothetical protein B0T14DRAFT_569604 [Immersiella caudata]|uniref:Uncharacterized protein n=1 Tax=Immersiella caudata TaxID=314043 RepID=A0AA39WDW0_9PEZI|nr:hypothetical protein B0T14DRAFT_569604 [Immersiella caudata]
MPHLPHSSEGPRTRRRGLKKYADRLETDMDGLNGAIDYNKRRETRTAPQRMAPRTWRRRRAAPGGKQGERHEQARENWGWKKSEPTELKTFAKMIKLQSGSQVGSENGYGARKGTAGDEAQRNLTIVKGTEQEKIREEKAVLYVWIMLFFREFLGRRIHYLLG